jgi:hypothetical protein
MAVELHWQEIARFSDARAALPDQVDDEAWIARRRRIDTRTFRMRNRYSRNVERKPQAVRALATVN